MSIVAADIKQYQAATMPASLTTSSVGGAINTSVQIQASTIGEIFFGMGSATTGGGSKTQYAKTFVKNTHASIDLTSGKLYLANSLDDKPAGNHTVSFASSSASDDTDYKVRIIGLNSISAPAQEEVTLNGTSTVTSIATWSAIHRIELRDVTTHALVAANGNITATSNATTLGKIPAGYKSATAEVTIGLVGTLDGNTTTTNAATAPAGISFSKPNLIGSALAMANSGTLSFGSAQAVWWKLVVTEGQKPSADIDLVLAWEGETT